MLSHVYNVIIYFVVGSPVHGKKVADGFNSTEKWLLSMLITTVQLPGRAAFDS